MNYQSIYDKLMSRDQVTIDGYSERHHILPRFAGGTDNASNLVRLSAREHFVAHLLLVKIYEDTPFYYKAVKAFMMMGVSSRNQKRVTSRTFERFREDFAKAQSISQTGQNNSQHGKVWITNPSTKKNAKHDIKSPIPSGWIRGRQDYDLREAKRLKLLHKAHEERVVRDDKIREARILYEDFLNSGLSLREFAKQSSYPYSHVSLIAHFKKYVEGFKPQQGKSFSGAPNGKGAGC